MKFFQQLYSNDFDTHLTIQLLHALDPHNPETFTTRGNISVLSVNSGELDVRQKDINQKDRQSIAELAKQDKFYRLKADVVGSDGVKTTFLTSSKAVRNFFKVIPFLTSINPFSAILSTRNFMMC